MYQKSNIVKSMLRLLTMSICDFMLLFEGKIKVNNVRLVLMSVNQCMDFVTSIEMNKSQSFFEC